jgi:predicted regulator of Ras-like GTPase activity (Roadblock/LC7/MglB family)
MSDQLARDPASLVFIELGETLRARGQLDAASKVVTAGLARHPGSADARDLYARILADSGDMDGAEREWGAALQIDARHLGAHKGLGFLSYRRGDTDGALDHLELALSADPSDATVIQALRTVRGSSDLPLVANGEANSPAPEVARATPVPRGSIPASAPAPPPGSGRITQSVFQGLEGAERGLLLVDQQGRVLGGAIQSAGGGNVSEAVAAHLAGVTQEAERAARMLSLGDWSWIVAEGPDGNMFLSQPTRETTLLLVRDRSVPAGRLAVLAERAAEIAARWMREAQTL